MTRARPLPRIEVDLEATVPGWALRVAAVAVTMVTLLLAASTSALLEGFAQTVRVGALALGVWVAWKPGHRPALLTAALVAFVLAFRNHETLSSGIWLAPLVYLGLRLCLWTAATGLTARVELRSLARTARTDGLVVAATVLLGAIAQAFEGGSFAGLVVAAVAVLSLVLLVRRTEDGRP
jgi:hypothetical protein